MTDYGIKCQEGQEGLPEGLPGRPLNYKFLCYLICDMVLACRVKPALMLLAPFIILL